MRIFLIFLTVFFAACQLAALEIVKDGQGLAEIVIPEKPIPPVKTAADELQKYIKKMSGAELAIVNKPTEGKIPIYVGKSTYTDKLGIKTDDIKYDGFKIIVKDKYMVLVGFDQARLPIPRNNTAFGHYIKLNKEWETYTGHKWEFPFMVRDPRNVCGPLGFSYQDATGTLYAVYDFLESLGFRWFMPIDEIGTVIPDLKTINVANTEIKKEPAMASREMVFCGAGTNPQETLWYKYLRQGGTFDQWISHSSEIVAKFQTDRKEFFASSGGRIINRGGKNDYLPRLASPELRKELAEYLVKSYDAFPELDSLPIGQPDGWNILDDRDVAAGWDKKERGDWGRFSDYMWDFTLDVAKRAAMERPKMKFNAMSYGYAKLPPDNIDKIPGNIQILFSQNSTMWHTANIEKEFELREEWFKKAPNSEFIIYDYYLNHNPRRNAPPVPVIFTSLMDKNFKALNDRCIGTMTELSYSPTRKNNLTIALPGVNHLMYYLHGKLTWNRNADMKELLNDYYEKFYGPAKAEMKEFFEYSEKIWMRPEARQITAYNGFLKADDVPKYFEILDRAKSKAGDSIYGKRIDFIAEEMAPMKKLFSELKRTGPYFRVFKMDIPANIDGDLSKEFWVKYFPGEQLWLKDCVTGVNPDMNRTSVAFRWLPDSSLVIGITCYENKMNNLKAVTDEKSKDAQSIWNDDNVEMRIETPEGYNALIAVNSNGAVFDSCTTPDVTEIAAAWNVEKTAVKKYDDRWTVEIKIKGIGNMPTKSYPWGINVFRQRMAGATPEGYALSPTGTGRFNEPTKMGNLYGP